MFYDHIKNNILHLNHVLTKNFSRLSVFFISKNKCFIDFHVFCDEQHKLNMQHMYRIDLIKRSNSFCKYVINCIMQNSIQFVSRC